MMRGLLMALVVVVVVVVVAGCARSEYLTVKAMTKSDAPTSAPTPNFLAYEHSIKIETSEDKVASVFESAKALCTQLLDAQCVILKATLNNQHHITAKLQFRAKQSGILKIIAGLSAQGKVTDQSMVAEDLERPIQDSAKKLEMLQDYRTKLEGLRGGASGNIDALIRINRELAEVQSEIETLGGKKARLMQRVETEILDVEIQSTIEKSAWMPINRAFTSFGSDLASAVSATITAVAYLIPWVILFSLIGWVLRLLWVRRKKQKASV
jgi:hypothetical protein